jgi:hypothetical protein
VRACSMQPAQVILNICSLAQGNPMVCLAIPQSCEDDGIGQVCRRPGEGLKLSARM